MILGGRHHIGSQSNQNERSLAILRYLDLSLRAIQSKHLAQTVKLWMAGTTRRFRFSNQTNSGKVRKISQIFLYGARFANSFSFGFEYISLTDFPNAYSARLPLIPSMKTAFVVPATPGFAA